MQQNLTSLKSAINILHIDKLKEFTKWFKQFKNKVDKLDVDELKPVSTDFKKLSDVVDKDIVKKDVYDELVKKLNDVDTR